jgi:hypothetical protein
MKIHRGSNKVEERSFQSTVCNRLNHGDSKEYPRIPGIDIISTLSPPSAFPLKNKRAHTIGAPTIVTVSFFQSNNNRIARAWDSALFNFAVLYEAEKPGAVSSTSYWGRHRNYSCRVANKIRLGKEQSLAEPEVCSVRASRADTLLGSARRSPSRAGLQPGSGMTRLCSARKAGSQLGNYIM